MKKNILLLLTGLLCLNACKKDAYIGKDPYAGARPALNLKIKKVTEINQFSPGAVLHLSGEGFSQYKDSGMVVKFNDIPGKITAVSDTAIEAQVPADASSGLVTLTINAQVFAGPQIKVKGPLSIDPGFTAIPGADGVINCIAPLTGGKFVIGGSFQDYGNSGERDGYKGLASIRADGTLDNSFKVGKGFNGSVNAVLAQDDGKLIVGGDFTDYNDRYAENAIYIKSLVRLNSDGSLDTVPTMTPAGNQIVLPAFNAYFDGSVTNILQSPINGKLTIFGGFHYFIRKNFEAATMDGLRDTVLLDSVHMEGMVRLNEDGSFDSSFNYNVASKGSLTGLNGPASDVLLLNDGRILLAGNFNRFHGETANGIVVIDSMGNADRSFSIGTGPNNQVTAVGLMADGRMLIAGLFTSFNGTAAKKLVLLNAKGAIDPSFNVGSAVSAGPDTKVSHIFVLKNKKIMLTGSFDYFSGIKRTGSVVLEPDGKVSATYNNLGALSNSSGYFDGGVNQIISSSGFNGFIMVGRFDKFDLTPVGGIVQLRY